MLKSYPIGVALDKRQPEMLTESYIERVYTPPIYGAQAGVRYNMTDRDYTSRASMRKVAVNGIEALELVVRT
jgi:hypothetical protein